MMELIKGVQGHLIACGRSVFYAFGLDRLTRPAAGSAQERRSVAFSVRAGGHEYSRMSIRAWLGRRFSSPPESSLRTAARRAATRSDRFARGRYNARPLRKRALTLSAAFCLLLCGLPVGAQAQTPTVSLRSGDSTMIEGNASNTATFTIALSRRLGAGEVIHIPIALSSPDGARLPGQTDNDFLTQGEEIVEGVPLLSLGTVTIKDQATVNAMIMQGELSMIWAWKSALAEYSHQLDVHTDGATAFFSGHYKPEVGRPPDAIFHCRKLNG